MIKPVADYLLAATLIFLLWPLMLFIFIINWLVFGDPIFVHQRIGKYEKSFYCLKFRSLHAKGDDASAPPWGKFLRYSSLDELPQLFNILRGEMSFVGPRPLIPEYLNEYNSEQRKRHNVKPGITGLAQVSGRNSLAWGESLALDVTYTENRTFGLDLKILLLTIPQVFKIGQVQISSAEARKPFKASEND